MKRVFLLFNAMFLSLLISCGGGSTTVSENKSEISYHENENNEIIIENDYDEDLFKSYFEDNEKEYKTIIHAVPLDTTAYFVFADKEPSYYSENGFNSEKYKMGLADYKGRVIIPKKYRNIGNPGVFNDHFVEIQTNNKKYGLFNLATLEELSPDYDMIFPVNIKDGDVKTVAYAKRGKKNFAIDENFKETSIDDEVFSNELSKVRAKFNIKDYAKSLYIKGYQITSETFKLHPKEFDEGEFTGLFFTPNFLLNFYTEREVFDDIAYGEAYWGRIEIKGKIEKEEKNNSFVSFIISFFEESIDGRGSQNEDIIIITTDKNNKVISREILYTDNFYFTGICSSDGSYRYINKNLIEVKTTDFNDEDEKYSQSPVYNYFEVDKKGNVKKITPVGNYPFTTMVKINDSYFKGCMEYFISEDQIPEGMDEETNNVSFKHYSIDDLDKMRAEILARHGFIFSEEPHLAEYFSKKKWYKAQKEDVTGLLTDIERYNLNFILEQISKMEGNEEKYTKPEYSTYYAAG